MKRASLILSLFLLFFATHALALEVTDLRVGAAKGYLVASWRLHEVPFSQLDEALRHGVPLELCFQIKVLELRRLRRDKEILKSEIIREIYYEPVKKLYFVQFVGLPDLPKQAPSLEEALELAGHLKALPLLPLNRLERGKTYRLKIRALLIQKVSPGLPTRVLRFIFRSGKIESDWVSIRFKL